MRHPIFRNSLGNPIVDEKLTADSFKVFLSDRLLNIRCWTCAILETLIFTPWDVTVAIQRLRQSHSPGPGGVLVSIIKADDNDIFLPLPSMVFNLALESGAFLNAWKEANSLGIHKHDQSTPFDNLQQINAHFAALKRLKTMITDKITN
ncbi:unnamed protein product [Schistocephalus solidus]|uniref:HDOD domain-containing protein n=1 Tax=Schistocephalus solidus TaxID=70667 RepID=A0A183SS42_SCHSO|nr:unnamed protein product [Schistocephalus solidus]